MQTIAEYETKARYPYSNIFYGELGDIYKSESQKTSFMFDKKLLVKKLKLLILFTWNVLLQFANLCEETVLRH
jgi:hypothetical protein